MRKITFVSAAWLVLLLAFASCEELGRIDQIDENAPAPKAATVTSVTTKPGGAIIHYSIPNDDNILGVKAVFERNGETCESMASRFVDSLVVEGFGDTAERKATVYAVGKNGKLSTGSPVTFTPETPPVQGATVDLEATFGGVRVKLEGNDSNAALAVVLIQDTLLTDDGRPASEIEWDFPRWSLTVKNWKAHLNNVKGYANHYQEYYFKYLKNYIKKNTNYNLTDQKMMEIFGRTE